MLYKIFCKEYARRKPFKQLHWSVIGAGIMDGELVCERFVNSKPLSVWTYSTETLRR